MSDALPNNTYTPIIHNGLGIITGNIVAHSLHKNNYSLSATSINNKVRDSIFTKSGTYQVNQSTSGDIITQADRGNVTILAGADNSNAIYLYASNSTHGGITIESGQGGINLATTGNVDIAAIGNGDITFGSSNTGNILIHANYNIDLLSDDFTVTTDNNITLLSKNGEIIFYSSNTDTNQCIIMDNGGNLIVGNTSVLFGYKSELAITTQSNTTPGKNGMAIYSLDPDISPELRVNYANPDGSREVTTVLGAYSANSDDAVYQKYTAYQHGQLIIRIAGPEFTYNDIGRKLIFTSSSNTCNITGISTVILPAIATYTSAISLIAGGIYTGNHDATIIIEIDSEHDNLAGRDCDTFKWSFNGGVTWEETFVPISYATNIRYPLHVNNISTGIHISFDLSDAGTIGDNWTIYAKIAAVVDTESFPYTGTNTVDGSSGIIFMGIDSNTNTPILITDTIGSPVNATLGNNLLIQSADTIVAMAAFTGFIGTDTNNDLVIKTGGTERFRVTADGSLCVGKEGSDARLQITSNFNKPNLVNDNLTNITTISNSSGIYGYQQNPVSTFINTGGYVIIYESQAPVSGMFRIYGNYFTANGDKLGTSFQISNTPPATYNQFQPHICQSYNRQSDEYVAVWTSQDTNNNNNSYSIKFKGFNNGNNVIGAESTITKPTNMSICLNPRITSYAGGYIIVYNATATNNPADIYKLYYTRIYKSGNSFTQDPPVLIDTSDISKNHVYPYVCNLSPFDIAAPGGIVITYLAQLFDNDPRYQIRYRIYDANLAIASSESNITNTGVFNSQSDQDLYLSDGLPSCISVPDNLAKTHGGFAVAFNTNYTAAYDYTDAPSGTLNITGLSSQAFGRIQNATISSNIVTLNISNVYLDFIQGEKLQIVSPDGQVIEKAALVTTSTDANSHIEHWANITLSTDPKEIRLKYYGTTPLIDNSGGSCNLIFDQAVNTSELIIDIERRILPSDAANVSPTNFTRLLQPNFYAHRPLTHITTNGDNECIVVWESGSIPHIYSQRISLDSNTVNSSNTRISTERLYAQNALGQRQTDPYSCPLINTQGGSLGYSITFGQYAVDLSYTAIQQELIGAHSYLLHINNQTADFVVSHDGQLGLNTTAPTATLHVSALPSANPTDPQTATFLLQSPTTNIDTINDKHQIRFADGNGTDLARIKVKYSDYYQDLNPQADSLISYFKFDELPGSLSATNFSAYNIQSNTFTDLGNVNSGLINNQSQSGQLIGFNTENCWTTGKINNGLLFNGFAENNYVKVQRSSDVTAPYPDTIPSMGDGSFAVSTWLQTIGTSFTGLKMGILSIGELSVGDLDSQSGAFNIYLENSTGANLYPAMAMKLAGGDIINIFPTNCAINDREWHHIVWDYYHSTNSNLANIWVDGVLVESQIISPGIDTATADTNASFKHVYIGANVGGNGLYYNGTLDELRLYKTHLAVNDINRLYMYGSEQRTSLLIQTLGTNNSFSDTGAGLILDDTGSLLGAQFRNNTSRILSGSLYFQNEGDTIVYGLNTVFLSEVNQGDNLLLSSKDIKIGTIVDNLYQVVAINSDTELIVDRSPPNVTTSNTTFDNVTIYPGIISAKDENLDLKMTMNHFGDLIIGNRRSTTNPTRLEIRGSGDIENKNGLTLHNTNTSIVANGFDTYGTRDNKIYFKTANSVSHADVLQGMIKTSLNNTGAYASQIEFFVNNNIVGDVLDENQLSKQLTLSSNSLVIGGANIASNIISGQLTVQSFNSEPVTLSYISQESPISSVFDSSINTLYYSQVLAANQNNPLMRVLVSHDYSDGATSATKNCGRMDFYTGNELSTDQTAFLNGGDLANPQLLSRFCITSNGLVGVHNQRPTGIFQVSPRYMDNNKKIFTANIIVSESGNIMVDDDITGTLNNYLLRGGTIVVHDGSNLVAYPLSNIVDPVVYSAGSSNIRLSSMTALVDQDYSNRPYSLHYPGMLVNKYGLVGIGNTAFGDNNQDYHLEVSGNTAIKGVLSFGSNISSGVLPNDALGFKASVDGSNLEIQASISSGFVPISDYVANSARPIRYKTILLNDISLSTDHTVICDIVGGGIISLNNPVDAEIGKILIIKNINITAINISAYIDTVNFNLVELTQNESIMLQAANILAQNQYFIIG